MRLVLVIEMYAEAATYGTRYRIDLQTRWLTESNDLMRILNAWGVAKKKGSRNWCVGILSLAL